MERVLDLCCNTGEWIFDLARHHAQLHICGIDGCEEVLQLARARRNMYSLRQIELRQANPMQPLPIPDEYVDFVHIRRGLEVTIYPQMWPGMIKESVRVLRPGGWLVLVELELCEISGPACMALREVCLQTSARLGRTMDESGMTEGVAHRLYGMLLQARLDEVNYDLHIIDLGFMGGEADHTFLGQLVRHAYLIKPLVVQLGLLAATEFDEIVVQANCELQAPDLCGWGMIVSLYGRKSQNSQP
jgi:SAM-dependent methyltransferase